MRVKNEAVKTLRSALDFVFPRHCCACGKALSASEEVLCAACFVGLPRLRYSSFTENPLMRELSGSVPLERAMSLFVYKAGEPVSRVVYDFKYHHRPQTARYMGRMLAYELMPAGFFEGTDVLVPMPITRSRRRERGYNQTEELARGISSVTGIKTDARSVRRAAFKRSQTKLTAEERLENLRGAFKIESAERLEGRHVLLLDDVITTGSTMLSCAAAIKEAAPGAKISLLSLARNM